jgi:hypothetical protein
MKNDKIIPGIVLVMIGAAILLANFGYLHFYWWNIFRLWPMFLVIAGVNLLLAHNKSIWATILKIAVVVLGVGLILFGNFGNRYNFWPGMHYNYSSDDNDNSDDNDDSDKTAVKMTGNGVFNEPYKADIKIARLNISGGGTVYHLSDTTNQLFNAVTKDDNGRYDLSRSMDDSVYVLDFHMRNRHGFNFNSDKNAANFRLNPNPEWEINVETGATKLDFDLSKFKVREFKIHGGAASFNVKLGAPLAMTEVEVETGVSGVEISIPQNAACSIETDSGLSDNHFEGFNKTDDNNYETPGYDAAKNKMHIHISGGLSDFHVRRY